MSNPPSHVRVSQRNINAPLYPPAGPYGGGLTSHLSSGVGTMHTMYMSVLVSDLSQAFGPGEAWACTSWEDLSPRRFCAFYVYIGFLSPV